MWKQIQNIAKTWGDHTVQIIYGFQFRMIVVFVRSVSDGVKQLMGENTGFVEISLVENINLLRKYASCYIQIKTFLKI